MKKCFVIASLLLACSGTANAQFEVKRIKCKDLSALNHKIFTSDSTGSTIIFQIVRDGCRPTKLDGRFALWNRGSSGPAQGYYLVRNGKFSVAQKLAIGPFNSAELEFESISGGNVSGTLDYVFTID